MRTEFAYVCITNNVYAPNNWGYLILFREQTNSIIHCINLESHQEVEVIQETTGQMVSFFELFMLRRKAKSRLSAYYNVLKNKEEKMNPVVKFFQPIIPLWKFVMQQGTW